MPDWIPDSWKIALAVVAGGGSNGVPVYSDGTNWRIG